MKNFLISIFHLEPFIFLKGALIFLLGPLDLQLAYLLVAISIDLVFGIQVSLKENTFKFSILCEKMVHKIYIYGMWIILFHAIDMIAGLPNTARWAVIIMLAGMEILSAAKNTARLGHNKLADALEALYLSLFKNSPSNQEQKERERNNVEGGQEHASKAKAK